MNSSKAYSKLLPLKAVLTTYGACVVADINPREYVGTCRLFHEAGHELKMITALDERKETKMFRVCAIFAVPEEKIFVAISIQTEGEFPSLTSWIHQASIFERKIATFFGLVPVGHPELRSLILHENWPKNNFPLRKDVTWNTRPPYANETFEFYTVTGEGIYEIPVGPVHAGIIEPGHFRFSVAGEEIMYLEPRLGYSHKGTEKLFEVLPFEEKIRLAERISGDSSFAHALAFCQAVEELSSVTVNDHAKSLRVVFSELERLANHIGDIGAIMLDTGFNFGGSNGARMREIIMRLNERLTASRFLRGVAVIGGCAVTLDIETAKKVIVELEHLRKDFDEVLEVAEHSSSFIRRLEGTGMLDYECARDHGVTGIAGKAVGFNADARIQYPYAAYGDLHIPAIIEKTGDVYARFYVRVREVRMSLDILAHVLTHLPVSSTQKSNRMTLAKNSYSVSIVEGWRGDIVTFVATDHKGEIRRVDVRDPSFINWTALGHAGRGNMVPDFPLINKSFNLSYSGNDL